MRTSLISWGLLALALAAWGAFGYAVITLHAERVAFAQETADAEAQSSRQEGVARLRATIQASEVERAALESVVAVSILKAVETIEKAAAQAGATDIKTNEATTLSTSPQGLSTVSIGMNAEGSFASLMRTASLLEMLPIPSTIERFEITTTEKAWRLTTRITVTIAGEKK